MSKRHRCDLLKYPEVFGYASHEQESFDAFYSRWPKKLSNIPTCVIENWIYRHWRDFELWVPLQPHTWDYELRSCSNEDILSIDHSGSWIHDLHCEGKEYITEFNRGTTPLAQLIKKHGTTPVPIIVAENCGGVFDPRLPGSIPMKTPYQLIEGHSRLACLFGMIDGGYKSLKTTHKVWIVHVQG